MIGVLTNSDLIERGGLSARVELLGALAGPALERELAAVRNKSAVDVMTREIVSIAPDASVLEAVRLMLQHKISGLPVIDAAGNLQGVVTEGDFLRRVETGTAASEMPHCPF